MTGSNIGYHRDCSFGSHADSFRDADGCLDRRFIGSHTSPSCSIFAIPASLWPSRWTSSCDLGHLSALASWKSFYLNCHRICRICFHGGPVPGFDASVGNGHTRTYWIYSNTTGKQLESRTGCSKRSSDQGPAPSGGNFRMGTQFLLSEKIWQRLPGE